MNISAETIIAFAWNKPSQTCMARSSRRGCNLFLRSLNVKSPLNVCLIWSFASFGGGFGGGIGVFVQLCGAFV
jgi:hypothetical protein